MKYSFSQRAVERWNHPDQHVMDVSSINRFKNKLQQIQETTMGCLWIPVKPYEPHLWIGGSWGQSWYRTTRSGSIIQHHF